MGWDIPKGLPGPMTGPPSATFSPWTPGCRPWETKIVFVGVPNRETEQRPWWDIWPGGSQGIMLAPEMAGMQHLPFTTLLAEGAYVEGAIPERTTVDKRPIKMAVMVNVGSPHHLPVQDAQQRWWASWSRDADGYIGIYTRTHGWRFTRVRLEKPPPTVMTLDPQAMDNNFMQWDMEIIACDPYWHKRQETATWTNQGDGAPHTPWQDIVQFVLDAIRDRLHDIFPKLIPGVDVAEGNLIVPTRGSQGEWPKFLVSAPGQAWIEDGPGGVMVELPLLTDKDGTVLVDTNPLARTLTATTDPIDRLFFQIARNSQLIDSSCTTRCPPRCRCGGGSTGGSPSRGPPGR